MNQDLDALCRRVETEMRNVFGADRRRVSHSLAVLENARAILDAEGGDPFVIRAAALLHDIGILDAERKHASSAGRWQELEGPPIARRVLEAMEIAPDTIKHVCRIVGSHHSGNDIDTQEFRAVWDADWLVNIPEEMPDAGKEKLARLVKRVFRTTAGRDLARQRFLSDP